MLNVKIIIASTRPGRKGPAVAAWIHDEAKNYPAFSVELIDLKELNLPFLNEAGHPRLQQYQHEHTKQWSAKINSADAFIIVLPEYNYSYPAPLKNAIDFLHNEWEYKPVALVSYGGVAAGTRSAEALKHVLIPLKLVPLRESIPIPFFSHLIDETGVFRPTPVLQKSAETMLKELEFWGNGLKAMRESRNKQ